MGYEALTVHIVVHILVAVVVLGIVATTGAVRSAGIEPLAVTPAAAPDGTVPAPAFFDIFLEIEGLPGESTGRRPPRGNRGALLELGSLTDLRRCVAAVAQGPSVGAT